MKQAYIYDIEVYYNLFFVAFLNAETKEYYTFEMSRKNNQKNELLQFLKSKPSELIGYNNLSFDNPLLEYFISISHLPVNKEFCILLKEKANKLINSLSENQYKNRIRKPLIPQIDLMVINRFNKLGISLKQLEFNLQLPNIQELPYEHTKILTNEEIDVIIEYCKNDIEATYQLYLKYIKEIEFRKELSIKYNKDFTNFDDVKIGTEIFTTILCEKLGKSKYELGKSIHKELVFKDYILDYIRFKQPQNIALLNYLKKQVKTTLKKAFTEIPFEELKELEGYYIKEVVKNKQAFLNIGLNGYPVVIGSGGRNALL